MQRSRIDPQGHNRTWLVGLFRDLTISSHLKGALLGAFIVTLLVTTMSLALLTRPIDRSALPRDVEQIRPALVAMHDDKGGDCIRWSRDRPLSEEKIEAFSADLSKILVVDTATVLPVLSAIRHTNTTFASSHHALTAREEFAAAAVATLDAPDRFRLGVRPAMLEELLPALERYTPNARRHLEALERKERLWARLTGDERAALDALVERWRGPLAGKQAQQSVVDAIAERVTLTRLELLEGHLREYKRLFGAYPKVLKELFLHLERIERMDAQFLRGSWRDGSFRDGWLRPFAYYTVGGVDYRLISEGASATTDIDDIIYTQNTKHPN